ncbi:MAG: hypothetical protein O8C67_00505 [Candidatus Methanoperedens sp.]|nr:hypothetical protein [Candidatus Methanoperedens sp.]MCZ7403397.1 hypothetical protein [Candidatus Methanoperedens sp.]
MDLNITNLAVNPRESINLSTIVGIVGGVIGILGAASGAYIWFVDRKNMRKATLYYPLYLACRGITEILKDPNALGEDRCRALFASCAKTLDEIVYTNGSIIHLKRVNDLNMFLSMKKSIDENLEFIKTKHWTNLIEKFKSKEFTKVKDYAEVLLLRCKEEVKEFKKIPG